MTARAIVVALALVGALVACAPTGRGGVTEPGAVAPVATPTDATETPGGQPTPTDERRTTIEVDWPPGIADFCATIRVPVQVTPTSQGRTVLLRARLGDGDWVTADSATLDASGRARLEVPGCDTSLGAAVNVATWKVELRGAGLPLSSTPAQLRVSLPVMPGEGGTTEGCPDPRALEASVSGPNATFQNPSPRCRMGLVVRAGVTCDFGGGTRMSASGLVTTPIAVEAGGTLRLNAEEIAESSGLMQQCRLINGGEGMTVGFVGPVRGAAFRFER